MKKWIAGEVARWKRDARRKRMLALVGYIALACAITALPFVVESCRSKVIGAQLVDGRLYVFHAKGGTVTVTEEPHADRQPSGR